MEMQNAVIVVTGGASGLGEGVTRYASQKGAKVVMLDLQEERGNKLVEELGSDKVLFVRADVTREEDIKNGVLEAVNKFQGIHCLVNCAGIVLAKKVHGRNGLHPLEEFRKVIDVNVVGSFNAIRLVTEQMLKNSRNEQGEKGVIINTASIAAFDGQIGQAAYSASKAGIVGLTLPLAREFAKDGIRVMTIAPGVFETPMFDRLPEKAKEELGQSVPFPSRLGRASEFAQLVEGILTNCMLNGETIRLDGSVRMM